MTLKKYLSLEQAQRLIPEVRRRVFKIIKLSRAIEIISDIEIFCDDNAEAVYRDIRFNKEFHRLSYKLFLEMESLTESGAVLTNLDEGIVYFYSIQNRKPVLLCWRLNDRHIKYWHWADEDFSARKPISKLFDLDKKVV